MRTITGVMLGLVIIPITANLGAKIGGKIGKKLNEFKERKQQ